MLLYDPHLDTEEVALRALYRLYRRAKWSLLEEVGIIRADHQASLDATCEDMGRKLSESEITTLKTRCPFLLGAAGILRGRYRMVTLLSYLHLLGEDDEED